MKTEPQQRPNPNRVAAGRRNRCKRRGLSDAGRERLREAARKHKPWLHSTGPRTREGKAIAAANGRYNQSGPISIRSLRAELASLRGFTRSMQATRRSILGVE